MFCLYPLNLKHTGELLTAERIVSLTPSITEVLFAMGAGDRVVGVTDACDYPPDANTKSHVCSWFDPAMDRIDDLKPDIVIGLETAHHRLMPVFKARGIQLLLLNPLTVEDAVADMISLGILLGISDAAESLAKGLSQRMKILATHVQQIKPERRLTVLRVLDIDDEWLIVAGPKSFQYDVISCAGGINVTTGINEAYPRVKFKRMVKWDPEMIFVCGSDKQYIPRLIINPQWQKLSAVRNGQIYQFDCGLTCRTGPRIVDMAELLFQTLYT
jgi:iron complex transport system substrate-binding protein